MQRDTAVRAFLALLAVLALALAAATLNTATVSQGGGGFGSSDGPESNVGSGSGGLFGDDRAGQRTVVQMNPPCFPFLTSPLAMLAIFLGFLALFAFLWRRTQSAVLGGLVTGVFAVPFGFVYLLLTACQVGGGRTRIQIGFGSAPNGSFVPTGGGLAGGAESGQAVSTPTLALGALLVVALVGSVVLLFVSTGDREPSEESSPDSDPETDVAAIGRVAGEAADRIERDADADNEVFRAWVEMTELLDVSHPRSSTPGEFAAAAVDAGLAREDVTELTRLFEDVRYGGADATENREARAVAALRRIEAAYADDGGDASGDDASSGGVS